MSSGGRKALRAEKIVSKPALQDRVCHGIVPVFKLGLPVTQLQCNRQSGGSGCDNRSVQRSDWTTAKAGG